MFMNPGQGGMDLLGDDHIFRAMAMSLAAVAVVLLLTTDLVEASAEETQ